MTPCYFSVSIDRLNKIQDLKLNVPRGTKNKQLDPINEVKCKMSIKYIPISECKRYPKLFISKQLAKTIAKDGLIEPVIRMPNGDFHNSSIECVECFIRLVDEIELRLQASTNHGIKAATTIIVVDYADLSANDKAGL